MSPSCVAFIATIVAQNACRTQLAKLQHHAHCNHDNYRFFKCVFTLLELHIKCLAGLTDINKVNTVRYHCNMVVFIQSIHNTHAIVHPPGRGMGVLCASGVWSVFRLSHCCAICNFLLYRIVLRRVGIYGIATMLWSNIFMVVSLFILYEPFVMDWFGLVINLI